MEKQLTPLKSEAKLGKKLEFDKIDWQKTIKNFNRYKPENRIGKLEIVAGGISDNTIMKPNPDWTPHYPIIIRVGGIIIIIVRGPAPKPKYGPCFMEMFKEAIYDKDAKFNRFSGKGIQHLVVTTPKTQIEILATPTLLKNVSSK